MASLNEVQLIGNTGIDPDIKQTSNGGKYAIFTLQLQIKEKMHQIQHNGIKLCVGMND